MAVTAGSSLPAKFLWWLETAKTTPRSATSLKWSPPHQLPSLGSACFFKGNIPRLNCVKLTCYFNAREGKGQVLPPGSISCHFSLYSYGAAGLFSGPSPHVIHKHPSFHCLPTQTQLTHLSNLSGNFAVSGDLHDTPSWVSGHLSMCSTESCHWPLPGPSHWVSLCFLRSHLISGPQTRTCKLIQFQI